MANTITKFKKYIDKLDEVYKKASLTADLDGDMSLVQAGANTNEIIIPKISMDGLANYSRNSGYVAGDVTLTNETVTFNYDRGRKFTIDSMDNEETAGVAFGKLASEFIRVKVVPEMDAFRFATYSQVSGIGSTEETLADGSAVLASLIVTQNAMDEAEVDTENRILYITPTNLNAVQALDTTKSREVLASFSKIVKVPQSRFYTKIKLNNGTSDNEIVGGYAKATDGADINYIVIQKKAVMQYPKHTVNKVVSPEDNQTSDGYLFFYRAYGLADVYENKVAGIYLSAKSSGTSL
jgi:hypothetical protein